MTNDGAIYLVMGITGQKAMKWKESFISNVSSLEEASFEMINAAADITEQLGYCYVIESVGGLVKVGKSFSHPRNGRVKTHENTLGIFGDSVKDVKIFKPKNNQDKNALEASLINYIKDNCEEMMTKEWCRGVNINEMIEHLKLKEFK